MGSKEPIQEKNFIISGYNIRKIIWILLVLIQNETKALQNAKIKYYSKKGRTLGGFKWPKIHFRTAPSPLSVIPPKKKVILFEWNIPKITFKVHLGHPTLNPKKTKLKLVKTVKTEPRKARFPWDIGLMFVMPMKYAIISGFNLFKIEKEI